MKRKIFFTFLLFSLLLCTLFSVTALAARTRFYDGGDFLDGEEERRVLSKLSDACDRTGVSFAVLLYDCYHDGGSYHDQMKGADSVVLLITKENGVYYYEMFLYGSPDRCLSVRRTDEILDDPSVYGAIKDGRLADGISSFLSLTADALITAEAEGETSSLVGVILVSVLLAMAVAGGAVGGVVYHYKKKLKAPIYPLEHYAKMNLVDRADTYITSHVTRTRVASSSSGSRSGGGGGRGGSRGRR